MQDSGNYKSVEMGEGGGYLAIEKSPVNHKIEEIEAGRVLADKGYKVILKDEGGTGKTPDGYLFSLTFEQRTPTLDKSSNIRNALFHARNKGAEVAVIYTNHNVTSRESIEEGVRLYENAHTYRFKSIIVVSDNGHLHRHVHNDT